MTSETAHVDLFAKENLPAKELWPEMLCSRPEFKYASRLNCASELLDKMASAGSADKPLLYFEDKVFSYGDILVQANKIAQVLVQDLGLKSGNRVLLRGPNNPNMVACWFAVLKAGGICVTTMPLLRSSELSYIVEKAHISHCLCDGRFADEIEATKKLLPRLNRVVYFGHTKHASLEALLAKKSDAFDNVETFAEDTALIAFTSGTTGKAKATMHFHRDVMAICDAFPRSILKADSSDIFFGTPPFAFTFGLGGLLLFPMRVGAASVLLEKPSPELLVQTVEKYKATVCFTSPTMYRAMLDFAPKYKIQSLRKCVSAGETLPLSTFESWQKATGLKIIDGIGATEMLHIFISAREDEIHPGTTGKVVPGYEAQVFGRDGKPVPPGTVGLLAVRGPTGCRYLSDIERQKEYVRNGWNFTGDAYTCDEQGYFKFHSRADDMIISAGYNISGIEVENVLLSHPAVKECAVVAAPDQERGHIVKAVVVLKDSTQNSEHMVKTLQDFVKKEIAPYKYPRAIEFRETLPRTDTGKLQRFQLRDRSST